MMFRRSTPDLETRTALAVFRHSPDALLLLKGGAFVECNAAAEAMYGVPRSTIIGQNPIVFSAPTQGDGRPSTEHVGERVQQALREGHARFEWFNMRAGEPVRLIVTLIPVAEEGNDAVLVQIQDLTQTSRVVDALTEGLSSLAQGDLTARLDTPFGEEFEPLRLSFNTAAARMSDSLGSLLAISRAIDAGCRDIRQASDELSSRTERQAASLEETSAAMQQLTQTVRDSAALAERTDTVASAAHRDARSSTGIVDDAMAAMAGIERSSDEIGEIISVIDGIAFQTNLLALNAGVEAARAGDAGKGFAVVAAEVRALAQRSAEAAKDVKARITSSTQQVERGVGLVSNTGDALKRIVTQMDEINSLIANITSASRQQAEALGQITIAVGEMDGMTQQNAAMVEETTAAVRGLADHAQGLNEAAGTFRIEQGGTAFAPPATGLRMVAGGRW